MAWHNVSYASLELFEDTFLLRKTLEIKTNKTLNIILL